MPTTYTSLLGFALPATGELSGTWGTTVNNSITELVEDAIAATATASVTSADWTLSTSGSGAVNEARCAILIPTGTPGVSRNINAPNASKAYVVINQSNAAVVIRGATGPTTGVTIATGAKSLVAWNGSDFTVVSDYPISLSSGSGDFTGTLPIANGGTGATAANTARTNLGATTVGANIFTLANPSAITFLKVNTDNSVATESASTFRGSIGAAASGANTDITALDQDVTVTASGTIAVDAIGYRGLPINTQSGAYTFAQSDAGKHIYSTNSGAQTITVPTNASVSIAVGSAITVVNNGTTAITFTTTGTTVYKAGTSTAWASGGTLAVRGMCTWLKVATDTWFVNGAGLS